MNHKALTDAKQKMEKSLSVLDEQITMIRPSNGIALLESVKVNSTPLRQLAQITTPYPNALLVRPYDSAQVKDVERAITTASMGLSVYSSGPNVHVTIPMLTGERRQQIVARIQKLGEENKVAMRNVRHEAKKHLDKDKELPEDTRKRYLTELDKLTNDYVTKTQTLTDKKAKSL